MKHPLLVQFLPPAGATIVAAMLLYAPWQARRAATAEMQSLKAALSTQPQPTPPSGTKADPPASPAKPPTTFESLLAFCKDGDLDRNGRNEVELKVAVNNLSAAELLRFFHESLAQEEGGQMFNRNLKRLRAILVEAMSFKDPKMAFEAVTKIINRKSMLPEMGSYASHEVFSRYAQSDPTAAAAWLDNLRANGLPGDTSLEGTKKFHQPFESALLAALIHQGGAENLTIAMQRLNSYGDKDGILKELPLRLGISPTERDAFAKLAQGCLTPLNHYAGKIARVGSLEDASSFISATGMTGDARQQMVGKVATEALIKDVFGENEGAKDSAASSWKAWVTTQSGQEVTSVIGSSVFQLLNYRKVGAEAVELIARLSPEGQSDLVRIEFVKKASKLFSKEAVDVAAAIVDPALRQQAEELLMREKSNESHENITR